MEKRSIKEGEKEGEREREDEEIGKKKRKEIQGQYNLKKERKGTYYGVEWLRSPFSARSALNISYFGYRVLQIKGRFKSSKDSSHFPHPFTNTSIQI